MSADTGKRFNHEDWTLLHLAVLEGDLQIHRVKMLGQRYPGDLKKCSHEGYTPLHLAALAGHTEIAKTIIRLDLNTTIETNVACNWQLPLHLAALKGHVNAMQALLEPLSRKNRIDHILSKNSEGYTPLHLAVLKGHTEAVKLLLNYFPSASRAQVMRRSLPGNKTLLHLAALHGHTEIVKLLLEELSPQDRINEINKETKLGHTALFLAASQGHAGTVEALLQFLPVEVRRGAINKKDERDYNAPPLSCYMSEQRKEKYKLQPGSPTHAAAKINAGERTPLQVAMRKNHEATVRVLTRHIEIAQQREREKIKHILAGVVFLQRLCVAAALPAILIIYGAARVLGAKTFADEIADGIKGIFKANSLPFCDVRKKEPNVQQGITTLTYA